MSNRLVRVLLSMVQFVGVAAFLVAEGLQLAGPGFTDRSLTINAITYLLGVNGIVAGCGHLFFPDPVADAIGWTRVTPWQWEVGLGDLAYGIPGVMAGSYGQGFWLATIIAASVFLFGAAVGHVRQLISAHNFSPGNAGPILFTDVLMPVVAIVAYARL